MRRIAPVLVLAFLSHPCAVAAVETGRTRVEEAGGATRLEARGFLTGDLLCEGSARANGGEGISLTFEGARIEIGGARTEGAIGIAARRMDGGRERRAVLFRSDSVPLASLLAETGFPFLTDGFPPGAAFLEVAEEFQPDGRLRYDHYALGWQGRGEGRLAFAGPAIDLMIRNQVDQALRASFLGHVRASPAGGFVIRDPRVAIRFDPAYYDAATYLGMFGRSDFEPGEFLMDFSCTVVAHAGVIPLDVSLRLQGLGLRLIRARQERETSAMRVHPGETIRSRRPALLPGENRGVEAAARLDPEDALPAISAPLVGNPRKMPATPRDPKDDVFFDRYNAISPAGGTSNALSF